MVQNFRHLGIGAYVALTSIGFSMEETSSNPENKEKQNTNNVDLRDADLSGIQPSYSPPLNTSISLPSSLPNHLIMSGNSSHFRSKKLEDYRKDMRENFFLNRFKIFYSEYDENQNKQRYIDSKTLYFTESIFKTYKEDNQDEQSIKKYVKEAVMEFCKGGFLYDKSFEISKNGTYLITGYTHQPLPIKTDSKLDSIDTPDINLLSKEIDPYCNKDQLNRCYFIFPKLYIQGNSPSYTGLDIIHTEDGVKFNKYNYQIDLTQALRSYFNKNLEKSRQAYSTDTSSERDIQKEQYEWLQRSTVMGIWSLIDHTKENTPKNKDSSQVMCSELVGLMRDDKTNQLYYFNFDLGEDIPILMNYAPMKILENNSKYKPLSNLDLQNADLSGIKPSMHNFEANKPSNSDLQNADLSKINQK